MLRNCGLPHRISRNSISITKGNKIFVRLFGDGNIFPSHSFFPWNMLISDCPATNCAQHNMEMVTKA